MRVRSKVNHDRLAAYVEHMKGVYSRVLERSVGEIGPGSLAKARNHIECLSMIQKMISEHNEMANGRPFDAGSVHLNLCTMASLVKPNGETILIPRRVP